NRVTVFHTPPCQVNPSTGRFIWNFKTGGVLASIGIIAGLLTGMLGVGGGFVIVPALRKVTNLDMHSIVATSLMIIFLISGMSIVMHIAEGFHYP
ncbi:TSUP family transporter, partial [Acinetobacter baumannii]